MRRRRRRRRRRRGEGPEVINNRFITAYKIR
jgi:hypothetical protein